MDDIAKLLVTFINGVMYFRIVCFEQGPDLFYLLRSRIINIYLPGDGGLTLETEAMMPNRFQYGKWVSHPTRPGPIFYKPHRGLVHGEMVQMPSYSTISPEILRLKIDMVADAILYRNPVDQPEANPMRDFGKTGYETLFQEFIRRN